MADQNQNQSKEEAVANRVIGSWFSSARAWITLAISLTGLIVAGVMAISGLKQEVAVLNERVSNLLSDHEKRLTAVESQQKVDSARLDQLDYMHNITVNVNDKK